MSTQLYLPLQTPLTGQGGFITTPWQLWAQNVSTALTTSGYVVGPASATANVPALFDGTTGKLIKASAPLAGTKVYYVSDTSGGAVTRKLTFLNGLLTSET